jgi:F0F1-type ATP synthase membrane subunit b/b'
MMLLGSGVGSAGGSFLDTLPDPMKPTLFEVGFIAALLVVLYFFLKKAFFLPLGGLMDEREAEIQAGTSVKQEVAKQVDARQREYEEKLRDLRAKAFERRKELASAVTEEKTRLIEAARRDAMSTREDAAGRLANQREAAKVELTAQVDALAESMVQSLLRQV